MSPEQRETHCPNCHLDIMKARSVLDSDELGFCPRCQFPLSLVAGKYKLLRLLGEGGFGSIYLAHHVDLDVDRERVIKIVKPSVLSRPNILKRFRREVQMTASISRENEHIVRVYDDFGEEANLGYFYVMEFLDGVSLEERIVQSQRNLSMESILHIFFQLCDAMAFVHQRDIIHRDLKPANLMLVYRRNDPWFLKVIDFGIMKPLGQGQEKGTHLTKAPLGTPAYMSPEQCLNQEVDQRSDIYAMGTILFELFTGHLPFFSPGEQVSVHEIIRRQVVEPPPLHLLNQRHILPDGIEEVVAKALAKKAHERFQEVWQFAEALAEPFGYKVHPPRSHSFARSHQGGLAGIAAPGLMDDLQLQPSDHETKVVSSMVSWPTVGVSQVVEASPAAYELAQTDEIDEDEPPYLDEQTVIAAIMSQNYYSHRAESSGFGELIATNEEELPTNQSAFQELDGDQTSEKPSPHAPSFSSKVSGLLEEQEDPTRLEMDFSSILKPSHSSQLPSDHNQTAIKEMAFHTSTPRIVEVASEPKSSDLEEEEGTDFKFFVVNPAQAIPKATAGPGYPGGDFDDETNLNVDREGLLRNLRAKPKGVRVESVEATERGKSEVQEKKELRGGRRLWLYFWMAAGLLTLIFAGIALLSAL